MSRIRWNLIILLISVTVLSGCDSTPITGTSSVLNDPNCSPPCWQNITPGITKKWEVKPLLEAIAWVDQDSIKDTTTINPDDSIKWSGESDAADFSGRVFINGDLVTLIKISPNEGAVLVADLIAKLGEPEKVLAVYAKGERSIFSVFLLYPSKGYGFLDYYYAPIFESGNSVEVRSDEAVKLVWYGEPKYFFDYLIEGQIAKFQMEYLDQGIQDWNGYGDYVYVKQ